MAVRNVPVPLAQKTRWAVDLILTKKLWMLLWCTHSYQGRTFNPLCYKELEILLVIVRFSICRDILHRCRKAEQNTC